MWAGGPIWRAWGMQTLGYGHSLGLHVVYHCRARAQGADSHLPPSRLSPDSPALHRPACRNKCCCLSHTVYSILSQQPLQAQTVISFPFEIASFSKCSGNSHQVFPGSSAVLEAMWGAEQQGTAGSLLQRVTVEA